MSNSSKWLDRIQQGSVPVAMREEVVQAAFNLNQLVNTGQAYYNFSTAYNPEKHDEIIGSPNANKLVFVCGDDGYYRTNASLTWICAWAFSPATMGRATDDSGQPVKHYKRDSSRFTVEADEMGLALYAAGVDAAPLEALARRCVKDKDAGEKSPFHELSEEAQNAVLARLEKGQGQNRGGVMGV